MVPTASSASVRGLGLAAPEAKTIKRVLLACRTALRAEGCKVRVRGRLVTVTFPGPPRRRRRVMPKRTFQALAGLVWERVNGVSGVER